MSRDDGARADRWVAPFFKRYWKALALALFLGVATFGFASGLMVTSGFLISAAAALPGSILMIHLPTLFVRIFGIGKPILQYLERLTSHDWVLRMTSGLRRKLYGALERDAVFFRRSHRTGDILGLLAEDIGHLQNLYLRAVFPTAVAWLARGGPRSPARSRSCWAWRCSWCRSCPRSRTGCASSAARP